MSDILDRVRAITAEKLSVDEERNHSRIVVHRGSRCRLFGRRRVDHGAFEEEFSTDDNQVEISDDDAESIETVQNAVDYLESKGVSG